MATRNRTNAYIQFRNEKKRQRRASGIDVTIKKGPHGYNEVGNESLLHQDSQEAIEMAEKGENHMGLTIPPNWMALVDEINYDISRIKQKMGELSEAHKSSLLPQFGLDDKVDDDQQTVEVLTSHITKMFQTAQNKVQRIGAEGVNKQEEPIKKNLQSAFASQLQEYSVQFRKMQKDYLQRLRGRQQKGKALFSIEEGENEDDLKFDVSFTEDQARMLAKTEDAILEREQQIMQIAKSINELAAIFKDLAILVVEQGTILDRIDYNIEQTEHNTKEAISQLQQASKSQKSYRNKLCMMLLCLCILVMVVVIIVKSALP
eukprot:CAMPEP_0168553028 /NCGR_PEP_ID=MMETSP0413-20121227/7033_1 /TAXON_ID=136452 /ORGANISM="Filamoeba nolandi, Strain NC-AS-23-1" /LENGTH=317 /DNA_ID=CAMNT_0008583685 /DNA_START=126 /DNA_END=1079 /DNA_ORIENTATION=-